MIVLVSRLRHQIHIMVSMLIGVAAPVTLALEDPSIGLSAGVIVAMLAGAVRLTMGEDDL